ncbi:uncharacterized protein FOMMEDRAFT_154469 [Fomitiporia mediterranea MF3/22]|uniref:uncharacterized protein n=1 Tax=Fomitiporia mediterranea (strain MF3/22) TaxID=694068 RepID=UPI000440901E|nr:uncharacterized protein FOMMEDRAFT_154469 [Fomitiporia mediterranea MF3/22]EJD05249.1 hypothetical protein FOMMEDRAFT_154469 [Fomitiporia mediterranea MF3/22]
MPVFGRPKRLLIGISTKNARPPSTNSTMRQPDNDLDRVLVIGTTKGSGDAVEKPRHKLADERSGQFALILKPVLWSPEPRKRASKVSHISGKGEKPGNVSGLKQVETRVLGSMSVPTTGDTESRSSSPRQLSSVRTKAFPGREDDPDMALTAATAKDGDPVGKPCPPSSSNPCSGFLNRGEHVDGVAFKRGRRNSGLLFISRRWLDAKSAEEHQQTVTSRGTGTQLNVRANHRQRRIRFFQPYALDEEDDLDSVLTAVTTKIFGDVVGKRRHGLADEWSSQFTLILKPVLWLSKEHIDGAAIKWKGRDSGLLFIWSLGAHIRLNPPMATLPTLHPDILALVIAAREVPATRSENPDTDSPARRVASSSLSSIPYSGFSNRGGASTESRISGKGGNLVSWWPSSLVRGLTLTQPQTCKGNQWTGTSINAVLGAKQLSSVLTETSPGREDDLDMALMVDESPWRCGRKTSTECRSNVRLVLGWSHSTQSAHAGYAPSFVNRRWLNAKSADEHHRTVTSRDAGTRLKLSARTTVDAESGSPCPTREKSQ